MLQKLKFLFVFIGIAGMVSCSSDDDVIQTEVGLVGTWELTAYTYEGSNTFEHEGQTYTVNFAGRAKEFKNAQVVFNENGTYNSVGSYIVEFTQEIMGETSTEEIEMENVLEEGNWELNGSILTTTGTQGIPQESTITFLEDNTLQISGELSADIGVAITDVNVEMKLTRL